MNKITSMRNLGFKHYLLLRNSRSMSSGISYVCITLLGSLMGKGKINIFENKILHYPNELLIMNV